MKFRNSINYFINDNKRKINFHSKYNEKNPYNDKVLKNFFLNNLNKLSIKNSDLIKRLNDTFRNYELNLNQKDVKITNNLYHVSVNRVLDLKNKLKRSEQLLREYENQYGFNSTRYDNRINNNNSVHHLLSEPKEKENNSRKNLSLNMSNLSKNNKSRNSRNNNCEDDKNKNINISKESKNKKSVNEVDIKNDINNKRLSISYNNKNNMKKYINIMINENRIKNKMRKIEQLSKLYNEVDKIEKKEIIDDNKFFKVENKNIKYMSFYREKIKDKKKYHFNLGYNKYKFKKIKDKYIYEDKSDYNYKTFYKKLIPKLALNSSDKTVNKNNFSDLSDISNSQINSRNKNSNFLSLSFPNIQSKNNKKEIINYSPIEKKNLNYSLKIYLKNKELRPIIHKTINEGKKINKIIRHNYVLHKEPKIKNNLLNILEDDKMDLEKLRNELNLKK